MARVICSKAGSSESRGWRTEKRVKIYIRKTDLKLADGQEFRVSQSGLHKNSAAF
jgi:hypothetical protein